MASRDSGVAVDVTTIHDDDDDADADGDARSVVLPIATSLAAARRLRQLRRREHTIRVLFIL